MSTDENLDKMREKLCGGDISVLSDQGKAFIIACGLKWHVNTEEEDSKNPAQKKLVSAQVHNLDADIKTMQTWPTIYMKHMAKWKNNFYKNEPGETWEDKLKKSAHSDDVLK